MFVFDEYKTTDLNLMHQIMLENSFATLVTHLKSALAGGADESYANHFPLTIRANEGNFGLLEGHMSASNPQWQALKKQGRALVIFQGPHAYIPPAMGVGLRVVPTWNYVAVHAYGTVEVIDNASELIKMLARSVSQHEAHLQNPWKMALPKEFMDALVSKIVGFKIKIDRLEPQLKLNQDREKHQRESVYNHLQNSTRENERAIAQWMAKYALPLP